MAVKRSTVVWVVVAIVVAAMAALVIYGQGQYFPWQGCTMVGCSNSLDIEFVGLPTDEYTVEVSTPDGQTKVFDCPAAGGGAFDQDGCIPNGLHIGSSLPDNITVKVSWEGGDKTETFNVSYKTIQPNGPYCEPTCRGATLTMQLP